MRRVAPNFVPTCRHCAVIATFARASPRVDTEAIDAELRPLGYKYFLLKPDGPELRQSIEGHPEFLNFLFTANPDRDRKIDFTSVLAEGYSFLVEMLYRTLKSGARVAEIPIIFEERRHGKSKISRAEVFRAIGTVLRLSRER